MIDVFATVSIVLVLSAQQPQTIEELRARVRDLSDSALIERARQRPQAVRGAIVRLADAGRTDDSVGRASLDAADRVAAAYATAWNDSFFVRYVARYRSLSIPDREASIAAYDLLNAANAALPRVGADSAMVIMRNALSAFSSLSDTTGMLLMFNNIANAFFYVKEVDSAEAYLKRSFDLAERTGFFMLAGETMGALGVVSSERGDVEQARERFAQAKPFRERTGDLAGIAVDLANLGQLAAGHGDRGLARRSFDEALTTLRSTGDLAEAAMVLKNLGRLAVDEGNYAEAAARYDTALATFHEAGLALYEASMLEDQGVVWMLRGDFQAAVRSYTEAVRIVRRTGPSPDVNETSVRMRLSLARAAMGDLQGARAELDRAQALAAQRQGRGGEGTPLSLSRIALARGDLAMTFNRFADAEQQYARAYRLANQKISPDAEVRRWAQFGSARVAFRREDYARTRTVLERLLRDTVEHNLAPQIHLLLGQAALEQGDTAGARAGFTRAIDSLHALGDAAGEADALARLGDLDLVVGAELTAETFYERALQRLSNRAAPGITWGLHAGLARVLRRRDSHAEAAAQFRAAIAEVERMSGGLVLEENRAAFQADKWDIYNELAQLEWTDGRTESAFETSERLRARQMLDLLARGRVAGPPALSSLTMREQDLRRQMATLSRQIDTASAGQATLRGGETESAAVAQTREALSNTQEAYQQLLLEVREANPAYASLVRGETVGARDVMQALSPDEALLEYLVGDSTTLVFVVTHDSIAGFDLKLPHSVLAAQVQFARARLVSPVAGATGRAWRAPLRRLYVRLMEPIEYSGLLVGKKTLIIAPHAELHYVPFATLLRPGQPEEALVERYAVEYVPSASVWLRLRARTPSPAASGVLAMAPRVATLPGSGAEVNAIRAVYGTQAQGLIGSPATEGAFRTLAPERTIVHLATHGVLNKHNPLFSFVQLGAGDGQDGRLEVQEVYGLDLKARLVVLSACQTGVGAGTMADVPPGDDWVGLVNAFLFAGAENVLGTLWPVQDASTARLMSRFYTNLSAGRSEAEALALAQRATLRDARTAHPFFWAGFTLVRGR